MRPANRVHDIALAIKQIVAEYYVTNDVAIPTRQQVTAGAPAWDCEMLAVWADGTAPHSGDVTRVIPEPLQAAAGSALRVVTFGITIARCSPQIIDVGGDGETFEWPTVAEEEEAAELVHVDEVMVPNAIRDAAMNGRFYRSNDWAFLSWKVIGPAGGFVASEHAMVCATDDDPPEV